jgi:hypothetical protein
MPLVTIGVKPTDRFGLSRATLPPATRVLSQPPIPVVESWWSVAPPVHPSSPERGHAYLLCAVCRLQDIHYLWRPFLHDPSDDMVLECAVASGSRFIVTHNVKDFRRSQELGIQAIAPGHFLQHLETLP